MRRVALSPSDFPERALMRGFEGAAIYTAKRDGVFYLIEDERTMADFLHDDELAGESLTRVWAFATDAERTEYARRRGWAGVPRAAPRKTSEPRSD